MSNERAILCGSVRDGRLPFADPSPLRLRRWGPQRNVRVIIQDVRRAMVKATPPVFLDLIDIATYVYCADQAIRRGGVGVQDFGENWRRELFFRVPVRLPAFWKEPEVVRLLVSTLSFLSEDGYHFEFERLGRDPSLDGYFEFTSTPYDGVVEEVMMFSGGIDSLGGAVQRAVVDKSKVILVNHRSTEKLTRRHQHVLDLLDQRAPDCRPLHLPVRINKAKKLGLEHTQRTRSFLYASLGATIAARIGLNRLRFYENGVVSLNLPPSPQVVGARATRTTHPQVLGGFSRLLSRVAGKPFTVENPFLGKTKTEVVRLIGEAGCGEMLRYATSCTRTWEMTKQFTHCGACSQCLDRRFAVLAAGQEANDPGEAYKIDLLVGERREGIPRTMLAAYLETANEIERMDALQFFSRFGEAGRVLRHVNSNADVTAMEVFDLHKRHAKQVTGVIDRAFARYGPLIRQRQLPPSCLLRLVYDSGRAEAGSGVGDDADVAPAKSDGPAKNSICRKGKCWVIRFDGQEDRLYTPEIGFHFLWILLEHPGTQFTASQLDCAVRRRTKELRMRTASRSDFARGDAPLSDGGAGDEVLDDEGCANLDMRLQEVEELLAAAKENDSPKRLDEVEELEKEKQWIDAALSQARGFNGRRRRLGDERNRVGNRVCNAVRRALKQVMDYDHRLFEHLMKPVLNLGYSISYVPRDGMSWSTAADCPC